MNRFLITLLTAALVGGGALAQAFPDIPANHWAGDAVVEIADLGIVIGFPDGTFRGNEAFSRYQAALVVSRLLAVVDANMDAELSGLRAAMQDLSSDVAAQGVRLSAAESAIAGISDDVAANAARIAALEEAMTDSAVLRDLQNQIASQRVAVDTAQAQAEAAAARADAAYDLALQALADGDALAADVAALNRALQILSDRVDGMGAPVAMVDPFDPSGLQAGIDRNAGDIANIREFVILLRRDQVALRDRVAALEAADVATAEAIGDLDERVTALERSALQISGSIAITYNVVRFAGCAGAGADCGFDVDRVYGIGMPRDMGASFLSTGAATTGASNLRPAQRRPEFTAASGGTASLSISVIGNQAFDGAGSPRALNSFSAVADLDFVQADVQDMGGDDIDRAYVLRVRSFKTTFGLIGADPLVFTFGEEIDATATPYVFVIEDEWGYLAQLGSPDILAFLSPTLWVAYTDPTDDGDSNRTAIRGTMAPSLGDAVELAGGFTYARSAVNTIDKDDVLEDNEQVTVWGLDGTANLLGIVGLEFEYASSSSTVAGVDPTSVLFVKASVDGGSLPILNSLDANFRSIAAGWDGIFSDAGDAADDFPFELDQSGFGVEGSLGLFILDISAFFDSYSTEADVSVSAFGVYADADLFAGFSLEGWFESVSVDGDTVDSNDGFVRESQGYANMDGDYTTQFGVGVYHDGDAGNALIPRLDLSIEYTRFNADFSGSDLDIMAEYDLDVAFVSLSPYVGYQMYDDAKDEQFNTLKAGLSFATASFDFGLVSPSLVGAVNYRSTTYGPDNADPDFTATELQWSVGVVLDDFLFGEYSTLSARYGQYSATNVTAFFGVPAGPKTQSDDSAAGSTATSGYEVQWDYYDLKFTYGVYETSLGDIEARSAQQFRVTYTVTF